MNDGNDKSVPKTYRVYDEEMTFVERMMRARQITQQSEYVRMLLWQDAMLHAPLELLEDAQKKRQSPKQLALTFTPRVANWEQLRVLLAHYVNAEMSAGNVPPAWTELFATQTATTNEGMPSPAICCSNPIAATIGFLMVCDSCKTELSPLGAMTICKWRASCAARSGNLALATEYERQAARYSIALTQENNHSILRQLRRRHAHRYSKGFFNLSDEEHATPTCERCKRPLEQNVFNSLIACECKPQETVSPPEEKTLPEEVDEEVAPAAVPLSTSSETRTKRPRKAKSKVGEEVAPVAVASSTSSTPAAPMKDGVLVRRCRNKGASKNVSHLVRGDSVKNEEWTSLCGHTLYPRTFPRANSAICTLCENAKEDPDMGDPLHESELQPVTGHYRVWDGLHDCAHTLAYPVSDAKYAVCGVWVANSGKSVLWKKAPENVSDCKTCAKKRGECAVAGDS